MLGVAMLGIACQPQAQPSQSASAKASSSWQNIDVATFKKMMSAPNTVVLDVRTPEETAQEKIPGAIEINYYDPNFAQKAGKLDKTKTYLVYCRSGNRSSRACEAMQQMGFSKLYNLQGGMLAWKMQ